MDKPLKDWTLGEMQAYCNNTDCENACWLYERNTFCSFLGEAPCNWDLSDPPRWTDEDIADAKAVKRLFSWADGVSRNANHDHSITILGRERMEGLGMITPFPNLQNGETVTLQEILDAEGKEDGCIH